MMLQHKQGDLVSLPTWLGFRITIQSKVTFKSCIELPMDTAFPPNYTF